jgi:hypothetical protein
MGLMIWVDGVASFFAGVFLANAMPHFMKGVCGDRFPTPFAKPPGKGLSSPMVNVVWALANLVVGAILFHKGHVMRGNPVMWIVFCLGFAAMSLMSSVIFTTKHAA